MRSYDDLCAAIASCGLEYTRITWDPDDPDAVPPLPHVIFVPGDTNNVFAGNRVVCRVTEYDVEVYVRGSSISTELAVEDALKAAGFTFNRKTIPIEDGVTEYVWSGLACFGI